ncbi:MAG: hypothetical protein KKB34_10365 [Bacteroidetes bacterium]|nr:hypothetical protein [Bacteroidota bacterium]
MTELNQDAASVVRNFNHAYTRITNRDMLIRENQTRISTLRPSIDEYKELEKTNKELIEENRRDREFIKMAIDFFEKQTNESVGLGGLFNQNKEAAHA